MIILRTNPQDSPFLDALGIPYCRLTGDQIAPKAVVCLEQGRSLLQTYKEKGLLDENKAGIIEAALSSPDLSPDYEGFFKKVSEFPLPDDFTCDFNFQVCACEVPNVHGYVRDKDDDKVDDDPIFTLVDGFGLCAGGVRGGFITAEGGVYIFRQMMAANLPKDEEEKKARYNALPEEVRRKYEEDREQRTSRLLSTLLGLNLLNENSVKTPAAEAEKPPAESAPEEAPAATETPEQAPPASNPPEGEEAPQ